MSEVIAACFKDMRAEYGRRDAQSIDENLYFHHKSELQTAFVENQDGFLARIPIITQQFAIMTHRLSRSDGGVYKMSQPLSFSRHYGCDPNLQRRRR